MPRWKSRLGAAAGAFLLLSGFAHTFLGTAAMREEMTRASVPAELARGLTVGWVFGGAAMFVFGAVAVWTFLRAGQGRPVSTAPTLATAVGYLGFGIWAEVFSGMDPFFLMFLVPAAMLLAASLPLSSSETR